ncbi:MULTISPECIES: MATE family efflux transporter [Ralstonia]|uniref:MATE family efflux transporter n=1 Tax=Ralstonia TaxID=48736 RepID=UPI0005D872A5|nr:MULTISPECIES: MATE family efflux transporter [Ralstonia]AJW47524.1 multidrug transporter MatE [Ralstonia mannitolilytica]MBU9580404.1 MATE family efflux transporter [Ralstonia mannitolilytica]PLT18353.1 MATE family efflux transporter [Ralstonia mannitolilytica]
MPAANARPLWRTFVAFLGPLIVANILQSLSGTLNNVYVGHMLGVKALAAVSAFFPILFFFIAFVIGLGSGAAVLIGQAWGAKKPDAVKTVAGTTLSVGLVAGAVVALLGGPFAHALLRRLGTPADILGDATLYASVMLYAMPGLFVFLLATAMMRGVGDTRTPLRTLLLSTAIGLVLTPSFIRGWFGLPQLGVASGAVATTIAFLVALAWLGFFLRRRNHPLAPDAALARHLWIDFAVLRTVLKIGVPTGIQLVVISIAELALLSLVNGFGSDATAAYGAGTQIISYVQFPAMSIAITASILGAQAIGSGNTERLDAITRTGLWLNVAVTGLMVVMALLFSRAVIGWFTTNTEVMDLAQSLLHISLWSSVIFGMASVFSGVMRASGTVMAPTAISILAIVAVEVPVAWALSRHIGTDGIWAAYPAAFIAMFVMQGAYYGFVWRRRAQRFGIRRMV